MNTDPQILATEQSATRLPVAISGAQTPSPSSLSESGYSQFCRAGSVELGRSGRSDSDSLSPQESASGMGCSVQVNSNAAKNVLANRQDGDCGDSLLQAHAAIPSASSAPAMLPGDDALTSSRLTHNSQENSGARSFDSAHETPAPPADLVDAIALALNEEPPTPTDNWRIEEANRRLGILQTYWALLERGLSKKKAVEQIGENYTTIWRWERDHKADGFNGLIPATANCGRKSVWDKLGLTPEQIQQITDEVQGLNLDMKSTTGALRAFANSDRCPADLAHIILDPNRSSKHALPPSLRDAAKVNKNQRKAHRGPRALSLGGIWTPRKMDILPGDIFSADDTTPIWAWWVPWYQCKEYPFGVKLLQGQFIPVIDVASQAAISYVLIAREKSSYRAADIWRLFGHTFDQVGLPRLGWQLERGSWEANLIRGQEVIEDAGEISYSRRVGGLRQLPTFGGSEPTAWHLTQLGAEFSFPKTLQTWTSYLPKTKSVESWFNRSQSLEGTLWGSLGRDQMRAPYEKAKKQFQACQRGAADPRLHFLSHLEMAARINGLLNYLNREPMEGEVFHGIPEQRFQQAVSEYPLGRLPDELRHLYTRDWSVVTITSGWARVRLTDPIESRRYSLFYSNPAVFAHHEGEQVAVYYDRENFERPAQIILARTGEYLCDANYEDRKGSFLGTDLTGHDVRKQWSNAVMSIYGTLVKHAPSRQLPAEIQARRAESRQSTIDNRQSTTVDGRPAPTLQSTRGVIAAPTPQEISARRERNRTDAALARALLE